MAKKRVRAHPSHYVSGLGDGKRDVTESLATLSNLMKPHHANNEELIATDHTKGSYRRGEHAYESYGSKNRRASPGRSSSYAEDRWQIYTPGGNSRHGSRVDPWQTSALALLAAVVLMSALFLHLITDTADKQLQRRRGRRRRPPIRVNKKTDAWVDDADEDSLEEEIKKQQSGDPAAPNSRELPRPPAVYYHPYQPRLQQRQPHGKVPSTNMPSPGVVAAGRAQGTTQPSQQGDSSFANNYYPIQSGTSTPYRPPSSGRPVVATPNSLMPTDTSPPPHNATAVQMEPSVRLGARMSPHYSQPTQPGTAQRAVALPADVSSFGSLTGRYEGGRDEEIGASPNARQDAAKKSPRLLSHGTEDVPRKDSTGRLTQSPQMCDQTPRVANRKLAIGSGFDDLHPSTSTSAASSTMAFASPPKIRSMSPPDIPYVPNLVEGSPRLVAPPLSVNVEELNLFRMESGNVSHWEARVAEESKLIHERVMTAASSSADSSDEKIPSNDPRATIDHKRDNLTVDTDASSSLQGFIDFDKLELIEVIGGGGFGQVWKAKLRGTPVAVKVLTGSAQSKQVPKAVLQEFIAEINLLRGMQHPNICLYMGACVKPPNRAIVTELAANGSLWDSLRLPLNSPYVACDGISHTGWPLSLFEPDARHGAPPTQSAGRRHLMVPPRYAWPWALVKKVAVGIARGMAYLHGGDPPVLHRDLKSANILLDESYNAKVCDFGLSRLKARERSMTGNCGTVQWMAPEVLSSQTYNERADIFSYGIICWELLTRQCPYDGMTPIQCALAVLNKNQRPEIPKWCPPGLHALIRSCVKKNPDDRPSFEEIISTFDGMTDV